MLTGMIARIVADALTDIVRDGSIYCSLDNLFIGYFIQIKTLIKIVIWFELRIIRRNWKSCIKVFWLHFDPDTRPVAVHIHLQTTGHKEPVINWKKPLNAAEKGRMVQKCADPMNAAGRWCVAFYLLSTASTSDGRSLSDSGDAYPAAALHTSLVICFVSLLLYSPCFYGRQSNLRAAPSSFFVQRTIRSAPSVADLLHSTQFPLRFQRNDVSWPSLNLWTFTLNEFWKKKYFGFYSSPPGGTCGRLSIRKYCQSKSRDYFWKCS